MKPTVIIHADWSIQERKRWMASASLVADGRYFASAPVAVQDPRTLVARSQQSLEDGGCVLIGFDFPLLGRRSAGNPSAAPEPSQL